MGWFVIIVYTWNSGIELNQWVRVVNVVYTCLRGLHNGLRKGFIEAFQGVTPRRALSKPPPCLFFSRIKGLDRSGIPYMKS